MKLSSLFMASILVSCVHSSNTNPATSTTLRFPDVRTAKEIKVLNSRPIKDSKNFVKAASGVISYGDSLYIVQDSSRYLAEVKANGAIQFHPLASKEDIQKYEAPDLPYLEFRKDRKADFESLILLPDGHILVLGSGYDAHKIVDKKPVFKNVGILFDPVQKTFETLNLQAFYKSLVTDATVVGNEKDGIKPRLNIEGAAIVENNKIAFFHRANYNKNFHDSVVIYSLEEWLKEVRKPNFDLQKLSQNVLNFGFVEHNRTKFPITLNDATYLDGFFYAPLAVETDTIVDGKDIDGDVVWKGFAKFKLDDSSQNEIFVISDPAMPKIEGISLDAKNPKQFVVVHDADDENTPSWVSTLAR